MTRVVNPTCTACGGRSAFKGTRRCSACTPGERAHVNVQNIWMVQMHLMRMLELSPRSLKIAQTLGLVPSPPENEDAS